MFIFFNDANFNGEADFRRIRISNSANFSKANFDGNAKFWDSNFNRSVKFKGVIFNNYARFMDVNFYDNAHFDNAKFGYSTNFNYVNFYENAHFSNARFNETSFMNAKFKKDAKFRNTIFYGNADFNKAEFSDSSFMNATFYKNVDFMLGKFNEYADFSNANFYGNADFSYRIFINYSEFRGVNFHSDANFRDATFYDSANFGSVNFSGDALFSHSRFDKNLYFGTSKFAKHVYFDNIEFNKMTVRWDSLKDALVYDELFYVQLIKNFNDNGQFEEADDANYQYRRQRQKEEFSLISWFSLSFWFSFVSWAEDAFMWIICGYGLKPSHPLFVGVMIVLFFSCTSYKTQNNLFWDVDERKSDKLNRMISSFSGFTQKIIKITPIRLKNFIPSWCSFYVSFVTFTTLGTIRAKNGRDRLAVMIEGLLGWLILTLFIVTLANVMIRP